jgi:hypothetical protein
MPMKTYQVISLQTQNGGEFVTTERANNPDQAKDQHLQGLGTYCAYTSKIFVIRGSYMRTYDFQ